MSLRDSQEAVYKGRGGWHGNAICGQMCTRSGQLGSKEGHQLQHPLRTTLERVQSLLIFIGKTYIFTVVQRQCLSPVTGFNDTSSSYWILVSLFHSLFPAEVRVLSLTGGFRFLFPIRTPRIFSTIWASSSIGLSYNADCYVNIDCNEDWNGDWFIDWILIQREVFM